MVYALWNRFVLESNTETRFSDGHIYHCLHLNISLNFVLVFVSYIKDVKKLSNSKQNAAAPESFRTQSSFRIFPTIELRICAAGVTFITE